MSLYKAMQNLKYDTRMTEMNITKGEISKTEWQQYLDKLPDMAHNIEVISMEQEAEVDETEQH